MTGRSTAMPKNGATYTRRNIILSTTVKLADGNR
jgi:hypothetical protein